MTPEDIVPSSIGLIVLGIRSSGSACSMSYGTNATDLKYRWSEVCGAFFRRYPNPWSKHVLSEDIISREVKGPVVRTVRVIVKKNKIPRMFQSLFTGKIPPLLTFVDSWGWESIWRRIVLCNCVILCKLGLNSDNRPIRSLQ